VHEMGITQEVLLNVIDASAAAGATRINSVTLTVGGLTDIVPDSLQFAWECLTPGTPAEGAVLEIIESVGRSVCLQCGVEFDHDKFDRHCEACGSFATKVVRGDELRIDHIDVDIPDAGESAKE
jgi:hydrogenase nickel incorporation protein HypA/HybF